MARKKVVTTTEEVVDETPTTTPEYDAIHDTDIKDLARETPPEEAQVEPKPEEPTKEETEEVDLDAYAKKIAEETAQSTRNEIADLLKGAPKDEKQVVEDKLTEFAASFEKDKGRAPNWIELAKFIKEENKAETKAEIMAEQKKAWDDYNSNLEKSKQEEETKLSQQRLEYTNELMDLYQSNKLTKIQNQDDPNDPGVQAVNRLFQTMADVNTKREETYQNKAKEVFAAENRVPTREELNLAPITSITRIFTNYYTSPTAQPPGADVPIFNTNANASPTSDEENYSYREVKNFKPKGWRGIFARR